jgi:hypothetical protein
MNSTIESEENESCEPPMLTRIGSIQGSLLARGLWHGLFHRGPMFELAKQPMRKWSRRMPPQ